MLWVEMFFFFSGVCVCVLDGLRSVRLCTTAKELILLRAAMAKCISEAVVAVVAAAVARGGGGRGGAAGAGGGGGR